MLRIGRLGREDVAAALRLSTGAGWNQLQADWLRLIELWPDFCLGGRVDGELVASATLAVYPPGLGWVGMVLVDPHHQKRGYGGAMLDEIIRLADAHGVKTLGLDATDQGRPVYLKRGFVDFRPIDRWVGHDVHFPVPDGAFVARPPDWGVILDLDRRATGLERGPLLMHLAEEPGAEARVIEKDGRAVACGFARPGRTARYIGPIAADGMDSALAACDTLLQSREGGPVLVDVLGGLFDDALAARGFRRARRLMRMLRPAAEPLPTSAVNAAACGFELG